MNLKEKLLTYSTHISFHTPSHCNTLSKDLLLCDTTELPYSDNLLSPSGIIKDLQNDIAALYNSAACFISTQGATSSVMTAIYAQKHKGAMLIVGNAHVCVFNAMRLFDIKAYHIDQISVANTLPEDIKTVILTSPDYFGNCLNLAEICSYLRENDITIIIDSSHGGHFVFSDKLPVSATKYGDLVIYSAHKTLPVATGGSLLLAKDSSFSDSIAMARSMLHSSSPSYFVLSSLSEAYADFAKNGKKYYADIFEAVRCFVDRLPQPFVVEKSEDFSRLVLSSPFCAQEVYAYLTACNIYAEMAFQNKIVFIVGLANYMHLPTLLNAFIAAKNNFTRYESIDFCPTKHKQATLLEFGKKYRLVPIAKAINSKLYKEIGFYPPGVPLFFSGHIVTKEDAELLIRYGNSLFGLDNGMVSVIK